MLPLLGRFKGETGLNYHLIPIEDVTMIEINNRFWTDKLLDIRHEMGDKRGWMFKNNSGKKCKKAGF